MGDLDNDMDELFRKAANHYPLKTDGADWDKIMGKLPDAVGTPLPFAEPKKAKSNRKLLWLILLFPLGWLCNSYFNGKNNGKDEHKITATAPTTNTNKLSAGNHTTINVNPKATDNNGLGQKSTSTINQQPQNGKPVVIATSPKTAHDISKTTEDFKVGEDFIIQTSRQPKLVGGNKVDVGAEKSKTVNDNSANGTHQNNDVLNGGNSTADNENNMQLHAQTQTNNKNLKDSTQQPVANVKTSLSPQTNDTATNKKIAKKAPTSNSINKKGFYITAIGGLDASSVKSQGVKKAGFSYGLTLGYNLNKHIAFEAGLMWDNKQYYTDGEYFDKTRTSIPNNVTITDMYGSCNMFEVPIMVRYNFLQKKKSLFFGTIGLSSYFMKKEYYGYEAAANGTQWYAMKSYNNSGSNLFSLVDLSVGYEHKIGKSMSLTVNPYLKIPLKGLGIGSLPITSSGVNIGITLPLHK